VVLTMALASVLMWDVKQRWDVIKEISAQKAERDRLYGQLTKLSDQLASLTRGASAQATTASAELLPLISQRTKWIDLFQDVSVRVPDGVWLVRMDVKTLDIPQGRGRTMIAKKKIITLAGFAQSYARVGQLLLALEQSPEFSAVLLKSAERNAADTSERVDFEIAGELS